MEALNAIPHNLKGRGAKDCVPIRCDCGEVFLLRHRPDSRMAVCPTCKQYQTFDVADVAFDVSHNGQA
jgi:hypothetical protein